MRWLARSAKKQSGCRRGRPKQYGIEVVAGLKGVWETSDRICSGRVQPFLPELVEALERNGQLTMTREAKEQLGQMRPGTKIVALFPTTNSRG